MSVVDHLKQLFNKAPPDSEQDRRLSLATPDASVDPMLADTGAGSLAPSSAEAVARSEGAPTEPEAADLSDRIMLPLLGVRSVDEHQKLLSILLGAALLVLLVVTIYALNRSDRVEIGRAHV